MGHVHHTAQWSEATSGCHRRSFSIEIAKRTSQTAAQSDCQAKERLSACENGPYCCTSGLFVGALQFISPLLCI